MRSSGGGEATNRRSLQRLGIPPVRPWAPSRKHVVLQLVPRGTGHSQRELIASRQFLEQMFGRCASEVRGTPTYV
jgi:hypothetical protein